ncbi:MAG: PTS system mannose/fructose/sorbose family transporter subunit IID [Elusimicrobiota bacterium]
MTANGKLRRSLFARSLLLQAGFGDERRQALGFAWAIDPALARAYAGDAAGLAAARARHLAPFNASPFAAGLPLGAAAALEERAARGDSAAAARGAALKAALGSALSAAADAFFWGALRPLAAATAVLAAVAAWRLGARRPFVLGAVLGLLVFNVPSLWARWTGVGRGLDEGEACALSASRLPAQAWIRGARRAAVIAIFAASWAALGVPLGAPGVLAASAFAAGALLERFTGGPLRLIAAAGLLGAAASAAGLTP